MFKAENNRKNNKFKMGFTLMEVMVATTIFVTIVISVSQIFKLVVDGEKRISNTYMLQESLKGFTEWSFRDLRMAKPNNGNCPGLSFSSTRSVFETFDDGQGVKYLDSLGRCSKIFLAYDSVSGKDRIFMTSDDKNGFLTPTSVNIDELKFVVTEDIDVSGNHTSQPMITIYSKASSNTGKEDSEIVIQTSLVNRTYNYEE
ncbi:MAG: hypothetical protein EOL97_12430 [Spirochaetia bacterium]|nr:hypothetical protein [Spirochaetia bacterium]